MKVRDKLMVAVSRSHQLASRKSLSLSELSNENFIMFNKGNLVFEVAVNACRSAGFEPRVFYSSLRVQALLAWWLPIVVSR